MIKPSNKGITFSYNDDQVTWYWWWVREFGYKFYSVIYNREFQSLKQYWMHVGSVDKPTTGSKIQGFDIWDVFFTWIWFKFRNGHFVLLWDINLDAKPASFWRSIPDKDKKLLSSEVVVLTCKDYDEMKTLCDNISRNFAQAAGIADGHIVYDNDHLQT